MDKIVFFGKGGIGKSTIASNISAVLASRGRRVLHVGCDPKRDSTIALAIDGELRTFAERRGSAKSLPSKDEIMSRGKFGIDCIEAGGPEPGVGCAGYGISRMLEAFAQMRLMESGAYDVAVFDILGDVVCGGFAAPLREGFADKVFIVTSEELASLYAANNIARAVRNYAPNGVRLGGLIANLRDPDADRAALERFAGLIGTKILTFIPRDPAVREAEFARKTLLEHAPRAKITRQLQELSGAVLAAGGAKTALPTPLEDRVFAELSRTAFRAPRRRAKAAPPAPEPHASTSPAAREGTLAGGRALARFSKLLGLGGAWRLGSAHAAPDGKLRFGLKAADRTETVLLLKPAGDGESFIQTTGFALCIEGTGGISPAQEALMRAVAARLDAVPLSALRRIVAGDAAPAPRSPTHTPPAAPPGAAPSRPGSFQAKYQPGSSVRFFFRGETVAVGWPDDAAVVQHGDLECQFDRCHGAALGFFDHPRDEGVSAPPSPRAPLKRSTDLSADDVVGGGLAKLGSVVAELLRADPRPELVVIKSDCTPMVAADDVDGLASRVRRESGCAVVTATCFDTEQTLLLKCLALARSKEPRRPARRKEPRVDLVGFPPGAALDETVSLLAEMGIVVGERLIPGWSMKALRELGDASRLVLNPSLECEGLYAELGRDSVRLAPAAPYGPAATRTWLRDIETSLGLAGRFDAELGPRYREIRHLWKGLQTDASAHRLGFVVDEHELPLLEDGASMNGLALLPAIREMGFAVELFVHAPGDAPRPAPHAAHIHRFADARQLDALLGAGAVSAVYSDIAQDGRLLRHGLGRFSRDTFELGFDGALRTARRLLRLCGLPFHRRYAGRWRRLGLA